LFALWAAAHLIVIGTLGGAIFTGAFSGCAVG
jgi:hypothetical protein